MRTHTGLEVLAVAGLVVVAMSSCSKASTSGGGVFACQDDTDCDGDQICGIGKAEMVAVDKIGMRSCRKAREQRVRRPRFDLVPAHMRDLERRIATVPLFNTINIPFLTVKWEVFLDAAKTFDRNRIFKQGKLWIDTGGGLRFETPTQSFSIVYGRSLRDGTAVITGYVERKLW